MQSHAIHVSTTRFTSQESNIHMREPQWEHNRHIPQLSHNDHFSWPSPTWDTKHKNSYLFYIWNQRLYCQELQDNPSPCNFFTKYMVNETTPMSHMWRIWWNDYKHIWRHGISYHSIDTKCETLKIYLILDNVSTNTILRGNKRFYSLGPMMI